MAADNPLGHPGELEMRRRLPSSYQWNEYSLRAMMSPVISPALARFIEAQPFFFIATSSNEGFCDASFRGREYSAAGEPLPVVRVVDSGHLVFPDYSGNGLYNSLGNILTNPNIGMLFMDFDRQRRARVNGRAEIVEVTSDVRAVWPQAQAAVLVAVAQAFGNCSARIPRLVMVPGSDMEAV